MNERNPTAEWNCLKLINYTVKKTLKHDVNHKGEIFSSHAKIGQVNN